MYDYYILLLLNSCLTIKKAALLGAVIINATEAEGSGKKSVISIHVEQVYVDSRAINSPPGQKNTCLGNVLRH
jgi:hypothetical protein